MTDITVLGSVATAFVSGSTTVDATHTLLAGSNRIIVAWAGGEDDLASNITGMVYDQGGANIAMNALLEQDVTSGIRNVIRMFYLLETDLPGNGARTVRATSNVNMNEFQIQVVCIQDAKQEVPEANVKASRATSQTVITKAITTISDGAMIMSGVSAGSETNFVSHGGGQTEIADFNGGVGGVTMAMTTEIETTAGLDTQSHTVAVATPRFAMVIAAFAPISPPAPHAAKGSPFIW